MAGPIVSTRLKMPQVERREADAPFEGAYTPSPQRASQACRTGVNFKDAPFGAPLPLLAERGKWNEGVPGASNNTGDDAWLFDN